MDIYALKDSSTIEELIRSAYLQEEPLSVSREEEECLVVMQPKVFERILFDSSILNCSDRSTFHL